MSEKRFSELTAAGTLTGAEILAMSQTTMGTLLSVRNTLQAIANWIAVNSNYTSALDTTDKTLCGAINELKQLISLIPQFSIEVVNTLPVSDISETTIYLVPNSDPEQGNYYEEYIYVNNAWELVGTTEVDLSAYYTKLEVDGLLSAKANTSDVTAALALKEAKADMNDDVTDIAVALTDTQTTAPGNPVTLTTEQSGGAKSAVVTFTPKQDLHGYDSPWVGGAGKNKVDATERASATVAGVTSEIKEDNLIIASGTATGNGDITVYLDTPITIQNGQAFTISLNGTDERTGSLTFFIYTTTYVNLGGVPSNEHYKTHTATSDMTITRILLRTSNTQTINLNAKIQLEIGSTATSYAPYENICPISGRTEASVTRTGKNVFDLEKYLSDNSITYTKDGDWFIFSVGSALYTNKFTLPELAYYSGQLIIDSSRTVATNVILRTYKNGSAVTQGATFTNQQIDQVGFNYSNTGQVCCKVQTEYGASNTDYEPYTAETHTATFDSTIYGGSYDFVSGKGSETWEYIAQYNGETLPGEWMSDRDVYAEGTTPTTGAEVAYVTATPTPISLPPADVNLLKGTNTVWSDANGTVTVGYSKLPNGNLGAVVDYIKKLEARVKALES